MRPMASSQCLRGSFHRPPSPQTMSEFRTRREPFRAQALCHEIAHVDSRKSSVHQRAPGRSCVVVPWRNREEQCCRPGIGTVHCRDVRVGRGALRLRREYAEGRTVCVMTKNCGYDIGGRRNRDREPGSNPASRASPRAAPGVGGGGVPDIRTFSPGVLRHSRGWKWRNLYGGLHQVSRNRIEIAGLTIEAASRS